MSRTSVVLLFALLLPLSDSVTTCKKFPVDYFIGYPEDVVTCTPEAGRYGCYYLRYSRDSETRDGELEGGCGHDLCRGKEPNCRVYIESNDRVDTVANVCCCYTDECNTLEKAERLPLWARLD